MSEEEKIRRSKYSLNRKRIITVLSVALAILLLCTAFFGFTYFKKTANYHVNYTEKSKMSYTVKLKPNSYYEDEVLEEGGTYVTSLIDVIQTKVDYSLVMDNSKVEYDYNYSIEAVSIIKHKDTKSVVKEKTTELFKSDTKTVKSSSPLVIAHPVNVPFDTYNNEAKDFINNLHIENEVDAELIIRANINIISNCTDLVEENSESHELSIRVPLATTLSEIQITSTIPAYEEKSLECRGDTTLKATFASLTIGSGGGSIVLLVALIIIVFATRNDDINYTIRVKKIVSNYRSYIQKLLTEFDFTGYRVLKLENFKDILEIRDTIQQPILMYENDDKTSTKFMVPTDSKIVYLFEILVEKYADIYQFRLPLEASETVVATAEPEVVVENDNVAEEVSEVVEEVIPEREEPVLEPAPEVVEPVEETAQEPTEEVVEEVEVKPIIIPDLPDDDEEAGGISRINYSFKAKLTLAPEEVKIRYKNIAEFAKSYGVKVSETWKKVRIFNKGKTYAIIIFKGKTLCVAYALDATAPENEKHKFIDLSEYKKYAETSAMIKITSDKKTTTAIQILQEMFTADDIKNRNLKVTVDLPEEKTKQELFEEGLIKIPT